MGGGGRRQGGGAGNAPGPGARGGGANGNGDGRIDQVLQALRQQAAQQQRLLQVLGGGGGDGRQLQGQRRPGGGGGHSRGGGDDGIWRRGSGQGGAGSTRARPGDWTCPECDAYPCFGRANSCFRCNAPRPARGGADATRSSAAGAGGGGTARLSADTRPTTYLGPVGAGGSRPLLGGRAAGARVSEAAPSFRVPGASLAARVETQRASNIASVSATTQLGVGGAPTDGGGSQFKVVGNGRSGGHCAAAAAAAPTAPAQAEATRPEIRCHNSWAALAEEDEEDGPWPCDVDDDEMDGVGDSSGGDGRQGGGLEAEGMGADGQQEPSEAQLRGIWQAHCSVVKKLERDRQAVPPEVLASVRAQRDAAEQRWRAVKAPHPLHKRLRWAENDWRAAQLKEDARRRELNAHLEETAARTRDIENMLATDAARTARKRAALDALLREGRVNDTESIEKAARVAVTGLGTDIGPALSAIIERLGDKDQSLKEDLQILSTSLGRMEEVLRDAAQEHLARRNAPERFDIGGGHDDDGVFDDCDGGTGDGDEGGRRVRRKEGPGAEGIAAVPRWTQPSANAPWRRTTTSCSAVEHARRLLLAGGGSGASGGEQAEAPSDTNDLAVAERRQHAQAQAQMRAALEQQQRLQHDPQRAQEEEELRRQREKCAQEEIRRHHDAAARAAAEAEAESARQKEASWAKLSPEEKEAAIKVREQQAAIGAQIFGTQAASHLAGIVHQAHVQERTQADDVADAQDVDFLMRMSPEEFARWDQDRQSLL